MGWISRRLKSIVALLGFVAALFSIFGCSNAPVAAPQESEATADAGYGRAFGRVQYLRGGSEVAWGTSLLARESLRLFVRPMPAGQLQQLDIEGDGAFIWPLRPGDYAIAGYEYTRAAGAVQRQTGRLMTTFTVAKPGQAVYIGDIRIDDRSGLSVVDRYADTLKRVESRLAEAKLDAVKGLMRAEPRAGSYTQVVGICETLVWQMSCEGSYQGVEPLRPAETAQSFPVTESLTPLLEWKPVSRPGTRYDVAIFESLALSGADLLNRNRMRGALVAYAEGLDEPRYTPANALAPGQKYEWTVRLRDERNTVSSWSTTSYTFFAVVAASKGSGRSFGFETPSR